MFNGGQSGLLFGGTATQNNSTSLFSPNVPVNGTTYPYQSFDSTDTLQKNGTNTNINTKLHCITAMKVYEMKSVEELRCEDYQANRLTSTKATGTMFAGQQNSSMMSAQPTMFTSTYSPYNANQASPSTLFNSSNQQTNTFGNKSIFTGATSAAGNTFGTFNNQSKPASLFGTNTASTVNKPIFGNTQPTQTTSIFGNNSAPAPTLFGAPQQVAATPAFFGGAQQSQQSQGLFGNTSNSTGFQAQSSAPLFGSQSKPFGQASGFTATSSTPSAFGNITSSTGGIFGQSNVGSSAFGVASKPSIFSGTTATTQLGQTGFFGQQQKPGTQNTFGTASFTGNTSQTPSLFGNNLTNSAFANTSAPGAGLFGAAPQNFNTQAVSSTLAPTIGYTNPAEALMQQQISQQRILSLVSNRPYGLNKLFMGPNVLNADKIATSTETLVSSNNLMSLAIKKSDTDKYGMGQRRKVLDQRIKIMPTNNLHKVFSGFDDEDDSSIKSNTVDKHFLTKREDWKYLPPNAFDRSCKSINSNSSMSNIRFINNNTSNYDLLINNEIPNNSDRYININNSFPDGKSSSNIASPPLDIASRCLMDNNMHSTPLVDNSQNSVSFKNGNYSPIRFGMKHSSPNTKIEVEDVKLGASSFQLNDSIAKERIPLEKSQKQEDAVEEKIEKFCDIKLTKDGYYTAPGLEILNDLVKINDDGMHECWVENFIVGRESFGSIRFPGLTNVYGLDLDQLVNIKRKEVSVYPDDETKPDVGEDLNKLAQVILHEVWPTDKSSGEPIVEEERLIAIRFEDKLKRITHKMGARFISYKAYKGVWVFEVDHFSKYRYSESDDDEKQTTDIVENEQNKEAKSPTIVSAEADSMTNFPDDGPMPSFNSGLHRLFDRSNNRSIQRMKENLYQNESDEEDSNNFGLGAPGNSSFRGRFCYKEEPKSKRFETMAMGKSIMNSSLNNSVIEGRKQVLALMDVDMVDSAHEDRRPIKPMMAEPVASTEPVVNGRKSGHSLKMPSQFRDVRAIKMPYLPMELSRYSGLLLKDIHKQCLFDAGICQGNRFRVGFHMSSNKESAGLRFFRKDYIEQNYEEQSSLHIQHPTVPNTLNLMTLKYKLSDYQERLLLSALEGSKCAFNDDEDCPYWQTNEDLGVLNAYINVQQQSDEATENSVTERIILLCKALWADIGSEGIVSTVYQKNLERKQSISKWIRMECRNELMEKVKKILQTSPQIDIAECNDMILESICCGEIRLACRLATLTKQHRMATLISQAGGSIRNRDIVREQLNSWIMDKTDLSVPSNIMCIYVLLSGQTSIALSNHCTITPLKGLTWYQTFGCYMWYIEPYLESIKSSLDLYNEDFKTDIDIPAPFPISTSDSCDDEDYPYYDCCYHLLKFYCDSMHDLEATLNPPTMSRSPSHKFSLDWSSSWHLSNLLCSLGHRLPVNDKLCLEWAAQLERAGQWQWAAFVVMHTADPRARKQMLRALILRHAVGTRALSAEERFLVEKLAVPERYVSEAKAVLCKNSGALEEEAHHWLMAGHLDRSYRLYVDEICTKMILNDELDKLSQVLAQFTDRSADRTLSGWSHGAGLYAQYVSVSRDLRALRAANKLAKHSVLLEEPILEAVFGQGDEELEMQIKALRVHAAKLSGGVEQYVADTDIKRICKRQMEAVCTKFLGSCGSGEIF